MKINFPAEPTPKINYLSKQNLTSPPSQNQMVVSLHCVPKAQSITDKLSVAHCALRVAPFTTSHVKPMNILRFGARRCGVEVAGLTLDRTIRVWFLAYPQRVWALWWQGGKRRLRTSRCPCRGRLGTLKTPSCPWHGCPAAGQNLETGHLSRHYIAEISLNVTLNNYQPTNQFWGLGDCTAMYCGCKAEISQNALFSCM